MTAHVLGLDLGIAHAGAAQIHRDGRVYCQRWSSDPLPCHEGHRPCSDRHPPVLAALDARMTDVVRWAVARATVHTVLAVVEGPAMAAATGRGQADERAGIRWRVVHALHGHGIPVAVLPPSTVKGYIAGKGNAPKDDVRRAVAAAWPGHGLDRVSWDEADAVALATAGADHCGWDGPWLDGRRGAGWLRKAQWPDLGVRA